MASRICKDKEGKNDLARVYDTQEEKEFDKHDLEFHKILSDSQSNINLTEADMNSLLMETGYKYEEIIKRWHEIRIRINEHFQGIENLKIKSVDEYFEESVARHGKSIFLISATNRSHKDEKKICFTYEQVNFFSTRLALHFAEEMSSFNQLLLNLETKILMSRYRNQGIDKFDFDKLCQRQNKIYQYLATQVVGLFMRNSCDFIIMWLSLLKLNRSICLININFLKKQLKNAIEAVKLRFVVIENSYLPNLIDAYQENNICSESRALQSRIVTNKFDFIENNEEKCEILLKMIESEQLIYLLVYDQQNNGEFKKYFFDKTNVILYDETYFESTLSIIKCDSSCRESSFSRSFILFEDEDIECSNTCTNQDGKFELDDIKKVKSEEMNGKNHNHDEQRNTRNPINQSNNYLRNNDQLNEKESKNEKYEGEKRKIQEFLIMERRILLSLREKFVGNNYSFPVSNEPDLNNCCFYIYTSGTSGKNVKAARFSHRRFIGAGITWSEHMNLKQNDRIYITIPLYHGNAGVVGVSSAIFSGCSLLIREKFSASEFFLDVEEYSPSALIYVGELFRYLLHFYNSLKSKGNAFSEVDSHNKMICNYSHQGLNDNERKILEIVDKHNTLRIAAGNGLRAETWTNVRKYFNILEIIEHYGQSEMPAASPMINSFNKTSSCGFNPDCINLKTLFVKNYENLGDYIDKVPLNTEILLRYDFENDQLYRDSRNNLCELATFDLDGKCIGEAVVKIDTQQYLGYTDCEETEKVFYRDVFKKGDIYYHSGDLLQVDKYGFYYFVDRIGDTFRRKGENISVTECQEMISCCKVVLEANFYGIQLPCDITRTSEKVGFLDVFFTNQDCCIEDSLLELRKYCYDNLTRYSIPKFVRIRQNENEKTSTFRYKKHGGKAQIQDLLSELQKYVTTIDSTTGKSEVKEKNLTDILMIDNDRLYIDDTKCGKYVPFTLELYKLMIDGQLIV